MFEFNSNKVVPTFVYHNILLGFISYYAFLHLYFLDIEKMEWISNDIIMKCLIIMVNNEIVNCIEHLLVKLKLCAQTDNSYI